MVSNKCDRVAPEQFSSIASRRNRLVVIETTYSTMAGAVKPRDEQNHIVDGVHTILLLCRCRYNEIVRKDVGTKVQYCTLEDHVRRHNRVIQNAVPIARHQTGNLQSKTVMEFA